MATTTSFKFESFPDIDEKTLDGWEAAGGLSEEKRIELTNDALHALRNDPSQFQENVKQVGVWANKVDVSFYKVTRSFEEMGAEYNAQFPALTEYLYEWLGFRKARFIFL